MSLPPTERFPWWENEERLKQWLEVIDSPILEPERRCFRGRDNQGRLTRIIPPLVVAPAISQTPRSYLAELPDTPPPSVVVLVQAGAAALGYLEHGELGEHKVIKSYMVRKKQGKSQLTHLKTKGKSRAGSRLRLRNARSFFEAINNKLSQWQRECGDPELLLYSCPVRLRAEWFRANVPPLAEWDDPRWVAIPLDVRVPSFKELQHVVFEVTHGRVEVEAEELTS